MKKEQSQESETRHSSLGDVGGSVSLAEYKRQLRKEQLYFPMLKFQRIREDYIEHYWREGYTPTDACNDMMTVP